MQSYIKIKITFKCIIGLLDFERKKKQKIIVKFRAKSDEFLDYAEISEWIKKSYKKYQFKTIEESLEFIVVNFKDKYKKATYVKIVTCKPRIIKHAKVGAILEKFF
ncbi:dihydroneopterin aldolase [Campylobacter sp. CCS1377]|uniref:Dihydroneopterin aldolase n=1 Tax=Campylobacter sp. CCS1377 TaxID=3158229 RepID=A0AAU7E803_9BACT